MVKKCIIKSNIIIGKGHQLTGQLKHYHWSFNVIFHVVVVTTWAKKFGVRHEKKFRFCMDIK